MDNISIQERCKKINDYVSYVLEYTIRNRVHLSDEERAFYLKYCVVKEPKRM
jgi:hypothetical protein